MGNLHQRRNNICLGAALCRDETGMPYGTAAYFPITGRRYRPCCSAPSLPADLCLALRDQFQWERRWAFCADQGAQAAQDPCLKELYQELAREGTCHAGAIRSLLEQMT